jgi:hypothetical protein
VLRVPYSNSCRCASLSFILLEVFKIAPRKKDSDVIIISKKGS